MAIYTRSDFAKECGVTDGYIGVYIGRGKVILTNDGQVDSKQRENFDFLRKQLDKKKNKLKETIISNTIPDNNGREKPLDQEEFDNYDLGLKKKAIDIEKAEIEVRLALLKEEKLKGELVPVVLVNHLFKAYSQSTITVEKDVLEELLVIIAKEANLTDEQIAKIRNQTYNLLNSGQEKAIALTKRSIKSLVEEFSIKKEVGEHE